MRLERLDFGARVGVPEAHAAVLATAQDVFGGPFGVADDVHRTTMATERRVQLTSKRLWASRRCHGVLDVTSNK